MKALILCNDFPPINSIGAERPYSWFLYFKENGIEPIVITKNWLSNGSSRFNDVADKTVSEKTKNGLIIKSSFRLTPSLLWIKIFKNKLYLFPIIILYVYVEQSYLGNDIVLITLLYHFDFATYDIINDLNAL